MAVTIDAVALAALAGDPVDWRFKGLPAQWSGRTPGQICTEAPDLFEAGPMGPLCVLDGDALANNLATMARWCAAHSVELAPHGKTHMSPQLAAKQIDAGACAITVATISQLRTYRAFGVSDLILANELVDTAGLRWLAAELNSDPNFKLLCWADSVRGVQIMSTELAAAGLARPVDVCVEVGAAGGRTGARSDTEVDDVARAVAASDQLRLVGVAGYEGALGHDISAEGQAPIRAYLERLRSTVLRLDEEFESGEIVVTAGGSTHFDLETEYLAAGWPGGLAVRTILRSGCYLTHDDGLYRRTSPLTRPLTRASTDTETDASAGALRPALSVWAQVCSRPEPDLALLTMGRRDVAFDQDLPVPRALTAPGNVVTKFNDQHAYLRLDGSSRVVVGDWLEFGISHPCTVFDKWQVIPVLDRHGRVVELIRTFF